MRYSFRLLFKVVNCHHQKSPVSTDGIVNCDRLRVFVRAGNGGQGLKRYNGIGGNGGSVIMIGDPKMTFEKMLKIYKGDTIRIQAQHGHDSKQLQLIGSNGKTKILHVPVGVDLVNSETKLLITRCLRPFYKYVIARGGSGGRAENCFQATAGEKFVADLHLKLHPNIGLIGFPNAGKSTLMKVLVPMKPIKIASYPFTTTKPQIGYIKDCFQETDVKRRNSDNCDANSFSLSIVDLPGLIEGAAKNRGRGREFLKHLEFSDILLVVVDIFGFKLDLSINNPYRNALETIALLNIELENYNSELVKKPTIVVLNKIDLLGGKQKADELAGILREKDWMKSLPRDLQPIQSLSFESVIPISAKNHEIGDLRDHLKRIYQRKHSLLTPNFDSVKHTILA